MIVSVPKMLNNETAIARTGVDKVKHCPPRDVKNGVSKISQ